MSGKPSAGSPRLRLFVAAELPEAATAAALDWRATALDSRDDLRLAPTLHLTLAFLGSLDATRVADLRRVLAEIAWRPARCRFATEPLFLPTRGRPRLIALRVEDEGGELHRLQADVALRLAREGLYEPETRPWLPHVTVARFRRNGQRFFLHNVNIAAFCVVRVVLYSSDLGRAGAVHTPLADFPAS